MTGAGRLLAVAALTAMAACSQTGGFDNANAVDLNSAGAGAAGSVDDPTSPAYFQQAIGDRVFFAVDDTSLNASARAVLDAQANWLLENTDFSATIEGHADEQGTREYNVALGERRANAAREYLVSRGVAGSRLRIVSYGKERPVEICSNEACYAKNRRAVTVLSAGLTG